MNKLHIFMNYSKIPSNIDTNTKILNLSCNNIVKIENLDNLINLEELHLCHNNINKIENLDKLTNLKIVYLGNNKFEKLEGLKKLTNLEEIYLNNNKAGITKKRLNYNEYLNYDFPIWSSYDDEPNYNIKIFD